MFRSCSASFLVRACWIGLLGAIEPVEPRSGGGMRVDIEPQDDTRKWRVDVSATGDDNEIVTTWRDGELADLDEPEWLEEAITRVQQVA
ncbi:MAG: hypothetical protein SVG88_07055 [Halobacteriales archaeon]|nr:hypothetical protein [Halobacteriales archaeon]